MEALHSLWCRVGYASRVSLLSVPRRDRELKHGSRLKTTRYGPERAVDRDVNLLHVWASAPDRGTVLIQLQGIPGLVWRSAMFWQRLPRLYQQDDG